MYDDAIMTVFLTTDMSVNFGQTRIGSCCLSELKQQGLLNISVATDWTEYVSKKEGLGRIVSEMTEITARHE